jgi:hypothetical protein
MQPNAVGLARPKSRALTVYGIQYSTLYCVHVYMLCTSFGGCFIVENTKHTHIP